MIDIRFIHQVVIAGINWNYLIANFSCKAVATHFVDSNQ